MSKFVYVGRSTCGCAVALVRDSGDKFTARSVAAFIEDGLVVNRESWENYMNEIRHEPTFMACPHSEPETEQLPLFAAA